MQRVCSADCKGICPVCGRNRNESSCDCHVEPDWVLVYRVNEDAGELILGRTGTHSDLF